MANDLTFEQASVVLNKIHKDATGQSALTPTNTNEFVSVAQTALKTGYDPIINSISQVLSRTIFSINPYNRRFKGIKVSNQRYGNIVRKISIADKDFTNDSRYELTDGESVDQFKVNKPSIVQTNFYGATVFEKNYTLFKDQLDSAFSGPEQFSSFMSMVTQNTSDMIEQAHENLARGTIANFIGGKILGDDKSVIHLLTEYNTFTGQTLTATDVFKPENVRNFMQWTNSRIGELTDLMTERSTLFQTLINGKPVMRHTPFSKQKVYLYSPIKHKAESMAFSNTYHNGYMKFADNERVNFWQNINSPDSLEVVPSYTGTDGTIITPKEPLKQKNVFGVIFDEEALGYTVVNQWSSPTPFNAKGGYSNIFFHFTDKYWNDFTEKGIVLLLD